MEEKTMEMLKYVHSKGGSAKISEMREKVPSFEPRIIGVICSGNEPLCRLDGLSVTITEYGKKALETGAFPEPEDDEPSEPTEPTAPEPPKPEPKTVKTSFVETDKEVEKLVYSIEHGKNSLLIGPSGCGKSFLVEEVAIAFGKKLWTVNCDVELDKTELVGHYEIVTDEKGDTKMLWVDGILPMAMKRGDWIVLDEVNMARPEVMSVMHAALDHRRTLTLKEHGNEEVVAHKDFRIFGSMNPNYIGTGVLNFAFRRRWHIIIEMDYLPQDDERRLLKDRTGINDDIAYKCVRIAKDSRKMHADAKHDVSISTAHLLEFAELLKTGLFSPIDCAKLAFCLEDDEGTMQDILNIVRSYF